MVKNKLNLLNSSPILEITFSTIHPSVNYYISATNAVKDFQSYSKMFSRKKHLLLRKKSSKTIIGRDALKKLRIKLTMEEKTKTYHEMKENIM